MKRILTIAFFTILAFVNAMGQIKYPVLSQTIVTPPYPATLEDFYADGGNKLNLQLIVRDVTLADYPVKLKLVLTGRGITISTSPSYIPEPISLNGGETYTLTGADLAGYFNPQNLDFSGYSKTQYQRSGRLPDGVYQLKFEVIYYNRNITVASATPALIFLSQNEPPLLNFPAKQEVISALTPQNIMFNWTLMHSPFSTPTFSPEYKFDLWEIWPDDKDPYVIVNSTEPIYSTTIKTTSLMYTVNEPLLLTGRRYAWRVRVIDPEGNARFTNDGYSEVRWFRFGKVCPIPVISLDKTGVSSVAVKWDGDYRQSRYEVRYREKKKKDAQWYTKSTTQLSATIDNLKAVTDYEVQVCGFCEDQPSDYSDILTATTKAETKFECGVAPPNADMANSKPLEKLMPKDNIKAGDFVVQVTQASGSGGTFSGKGNVLVPYLKYLKVEVDFKNIKVNEDYRLTDGVIYTVYNLNNSMVLKTANPSFLIPDPTKPVETNDFTKIAGAKTSTDTTVSHIEFTGDVVRITYDNGKTVEVRASKDGLVAANNDKNADQPQYVADTKTKTLYTGTPETRGSNANTSNVTPQPKNSGTTYHVTFARHNLQTYGFDAPDATKPAGNYESVSIDGQPYLVPWKSIEAGHADRVKAKITGGSKDSIRYRRESELLVMTAPGDADTTQILLSGQGDMEEDNVYAWYPEYTKVKDSVTSQNRVLAGQVNMVSYEKQQITVYLVPVNGSIYPGNITDVQNYLNNIYGPALVEWNVQKVEGFEVSVNGSKSKKIDNVVNDDNMDYSADEKVVYNAFKDHPQYNKNAYYLFFFDDATNPNIKGYMPFNQHFGFIFKYNQRLDVYLRTIAHELGHGPFRLYHTFSDKNKYVQTQGRTSNIMDYVDDGKAQTAVNLQKYQWDEIHSWHLGANWLEDKEEGQLGTGSHYCISDNIVDILKQWHVYKTPEPEGKSRSFLLPANAIPCSFYYGDATAINGSLSTFMIDGLLYQTWFDATTKEFSGYGYNNEKDFKIVLSDEKPTLVSVTSGKATIKHDTYSNTVDILGLCAKYTHLSQAAEALYYSLSGNSNLDKGKLDRLIFYVNSLDDEYAKIVLNRVYEISGLAKIDFEVFYQVQPLPSNESLDDLLLIFQGFSNLKNKACTITRDELLLYAAYYYDNIDFLNELSLDERICLIKTLTSAACKDISNTVSSQIKAENYCEKFVISLFKTVKEDDYEKFLVKLNEQGLLWKLSHRLDDKFLFFGSEDNYKTFCFLVLKYYLNVANKNGGSFNGTKLNPYYIKWDDDIINNENSLITIVEADNKISIKDPNTLKLLKDLSVFDLVTIKTINDNDILQVPKNTEIYAPAIFLDYLVFKSAMRDFKVIGETTLDIVSLCTGIGEFYEAANVGVKIYRGVQVALAASDLIMKNSVVKGKIKSCFATDAEGEAFIKKYETVSMILNSGFMVFDLAVKLPNEAKEFSVLFKKAKEAGLEEKLEKNVYQELEKIANKADEEAKILAKEQELLNDAKKQLNEHGYNEEYADEIMATVQEGNCGVECAFGIYGCFADHTQVETESGMQSISAIQKGMNVFSYNHQKNRKELKMVSNIRKYLTKSLIVLGLSSGQQIMATPNHPFYVSNKYIEASSLHIGDTLFSEKNIVVNSITNKDTSATVYNFTVLDNSNYFITNDRILVHNTCFAGRLEKYEHLTQELDKLSPAAKRRFMETFVSEGDDVLEILNNGNALKAWKKLSELEGTKTWVSKNKNLLKKLSDKDEDYINRVKTYYSKHSSPDDVKVYPSTSNSGIYYDEFGHPDFTNYVPVLSDGRRPVFKPDMNSKEVLTGKGTDMGNANKWALKPQNEGGGGFIEGVNFKKSGSGCTILDKDKGWVDCTWHHCEDGVTMIPVPVDIHARFNAAHLGGRQIINERLQNFFPSPIFKN